MAAAGSNSWAQVEGRHDLLATHFDNAIDALARPVFLIEGAAPRRIGDIIGSDDWVSAISFCCSAPIRAASGVCVKNMLPEQRRCWKKVAMLRSRKRKGLAFTPTSTQGEIEAADADWWGHHASQAPWLSPVRCCPACP